VAAVDQRRQGVEITKWGMDKALGQRLKALMKFQLPGGRHRRQGPAVERTGQEMISVAPRPG
jgi:hypothetical protein